MGKAAQLLERRKKAKQRLNDVMKNSDRVVVIHYSCESFHDRPEGSSPRITSIAVRNLASGQTTSFSIHQMAEREGIPFSEIDSNYDNLEREALRGFYEYVQTHSGYKWLHWNMRDISYGFAAIGHRYQVLGGLPIEIHDSQIEDLSRLLVQIYGIGYINHPRLSNIVALNDISDLDFLAGEAEAKAFTDKQYVRLHLSTLRKVDILANLAERAEVGKLKTRTRWYHDFALYPQAGADFIQEHWIPVILVFIATIVPFVVWLWQGIMTR